MTVVGKAKFILDFLRVSDTVKTAVGAITALSAGTSVAPTGDTETAATRFAFNALIVAESTEDTNVLLSVGDTAVPVIPTVVGVALGSVTPGALLDNDVPLVAGVGPPTDTVWNQGFSGIDVDV